MRLFTIHCGDCYIESQLYEVVKSYIPPADINDGRDITTLTEVNIPSRVQIVTIFIMAGLGCGT